MERVGWYDMEIKIDWDWKTIDIVKYADRLWTASKRIEFGIKKVEIFETKNGFHAYIRIDKEIDDRELAFIQLLLGSDWQRELMNLARIKNNVPMEKGNKLFEKKYLIKASNGDVYFHGKEEKTPIAQVYEETFKWRLEQRNKEYSENRKEAEPK